MRAVVQRVSSAFVEVDGRRVGAIQAGLVLFLGVRKGDGEAQVRHLAEKVLDLRVFPDEKHHMNRSIRDAGGEILLVSQFTLYGDCRKGCRPSFSEAEAPVRANEVYRDFAIYLAGCGFPPQEGIFGAAMTVHVANEGPVTMLLDSERGF